MPYPGPAIAWPDANTFINPDPETGLLPGAPCPACGTENLVAIVLHRQGKRLVALCCRAPHCTSGASPAAPF